MFTGNTYISKHILYYIHVFNLTTNDDDLLVRNTTTNK